MKRTRITFVLSHLFFDSTVAAPPCDAIIEAPKRTASKPAVRRSIIDPLAEREKPEPGIQAAVPGF
jgi:hypothetical protein